MIPLLSLFLICVVVMPAVGETLRERHRAAQRRKRIDAFLRDSPVADYHLD
jgi:hypothetical protein